MADTEAPAAAPAAPATPAKKGRKPKDGAAKKAKSDRPPTMQLIEKAIESEKDPKGTSVLAIKKYITANYQVKSAQFLNHMLRRAFEAGLAAGKLSRPKGQGESHLLAGRYRLAVKEKKAKAAPAKPKKVVKKPKAAKSPAKKAAAKPKKAKTPKKKPAAAAKKAKSPKKVKKTPKKPAAKKTAAKKTLKKAAKKA
ncbi:Histone H5 [Amphibalanus amphitrite]|uniref:Histone H5 n=1 Tax=Amphibalanus amphitrite TaxID=1232801 RepID=A0A6A4W383_AMPAM|nr:histone H1-like [Amphibalanus amphitrite]KAF0300363.1 Histone H5 [Amphibalanus amphitrite]